MLRITLNELEILIENAPKVDPAINKDRFIYHRLDISQQLKVIEWVYNISGNLADLQYLQDSWRQGQAFEVVTILNQNTDRIKARLLECFESEGFAQAEQELLELVNA